MGDGPTEVLVHGSDGVGGAEGSEAVKAHYESLIATGKNRLEFEVTPVVADEHMVVTDGVFRHACTGHTLLERRVTGNVELTGLGGTSRSIGALVVWRMTPPGLVDGEDIYTSVPSTEADEFRPSAVTSLSADLSDRAVMPLSL